MVSDNLVSVIVPVYRTERYLNRCIESIVNQDYRNLEIIIVDDGSDDGCPAICDYWAQKDLRIRVIHKENEGLGAARNTGIETASGDFICFFDSDDHIAPATLSECVKVANENNADAVFFGNDYAAQNGRIVHVRKPCAPKNIFAGYEVMQTLLPMTLASDASSGEDWCLSLSACCGLFSAEVIRTSGWRFVSEKEIISEDYYSVCELYRYLKKVCIIDKIFYHYTQNENSLTKTYRKDRYEKLCYFAEEMFKLSESMGCEKSLEAPIKTAFLGFVIGALKQVADSGDSFKEKYYNLKNIICDEYLRNILHTHNYSGENMKKKILFFFIKRRMVLLSFLIIGLRNTEKR